MQMRIEVVQFLFVYSLTSVYLLNLSCSVVIFTHKARIVDTKDNPIQLALPQ